MTWNSAAYRDTRMEFDQTHGNCIVKSAFVERFHVVCSMKDEAACLTHRRIQVSRFDMIIEERRVGSQPRIHFLRAINVIDRTRTIASFASSHGA